MLASTSSGSETSQKGCAQMATPPASWIASIASRDGGRLAQAEGRPALDQVAADQRADVVDVLLLQPRGVGRAGEHRPGQVGAADRLAGGACARRSRLRRARSPTSRRAAAMRSVRCSRSAEELGQPAGEQRARCGRCGSRGCAVRGRDVGGAVVDGGDLDGGDDAHAEPLAGRERLGDAADRVVVGQRQQLDAGLGGAAHDLGRRAGRRRSGSSGTAGRSGAASRGSLCDRSVRRRARAVERSCASASARTASTVSARATARAGGARRRGSGGPCRTARGLRSASIASSSAKRGVGLGAALGGLDPEDLEVGERGAELLLGQRTSGRSSSRSTGTHLVAQPALLGVGAQQQADVG